MNTRLKNFVKAVIPPIILNALKKRSRYGFFGDFGNWNEARADSSGYDSPLILEKALASALKVKSGQAVAERDGVSFSTAQYSWHILAIVLWSVARNNKLDIVDFGGGLGMSYIQHRKFLSHIHNLTWRVVEQPNFATAGQKYFQDDRLSFSDSLSETLHKATPQLFLASSSLQYVEKPDDILSRVIEKKYECIVFDRTPMWDKPELLTVQKVPPRIYDASYPAWIFNKEKLVHFFIDHGYSLLAESNEGTMSYDGQADTVLLMHLTFVRK